MMIRERAEGLEVWSSSPTTTTSLLSPLLMMMVLPLPRSVSTWQRRQLAACYLHLHYHYYCSSERWM